MTQILERVRTDGREVVVGSVVDLGTALEGLDQELEKLVQTAEVCQNCRHWAPRKFGAPIPVGKGQCRFVKVGLYGLGPDAVTMTPGTAQLLTPATFGCRGWEAKTEKR